MLLRKDEFQYPADPMKLVVGELYLAVDKLGRYDNWWGIGEFKERKPAFFGGSWAIWAYWCSPPHSDYHLTEVNWRREGSAGWVDAEKMDFFSRGKIIRPKSGFGKFIEKHNL